MDHDHDTIPEQLTEIRSACWAMLSRGVVDRRHPFHLGVLCTAGTAGFPDARTVVLRGADEPSMTLRCHTDRRSPKFASLRSDPGCAWVFYDPGVRVQIRALGVADLHTDDGVADAAWEASGAHSRRCYASRQAPSGVIAAPGPQPEIDGEDWTFARSHFAVIVTRVVRLEWLRLHHGGHRRARFDDVTPDGVWIQP